MNPLQRSSQLPPGLAGRLNPVCDRFEAQWQAGGVPRWEDFLPLVGEPDRPALLRELLELEVYYRGRRGEPASSEDYRRRLLGHADLIRAAFAPPHGPAAVPLTPAAQEAAARVDPINTEDYAPPPAPGGTQDYVAEAAGLPPNGQSAAGELPGTSEPGVVVPGYDILSQLGRGAMGVVYKARQHKPSRIVALKMIRWGPHADAHEIARFQAEAEAVAQLRHPNIVTLYEFGQHEQIPYFTLEFVPGGSLEDRLRQGPLQPRTAAALVEQLARGMNHAHAHERGIVHRDLKPANILLEEDGTPRITDFGLVKRVDTDAQLSEIGAVVGTASYMAPEQARASRDVGPPADTYALGAVLYACVTGRPPFQGPSWLDTLRLVAGTEPVPPSRLQPKLPRDLETICLKCLQKEPTRRYRTAVDLADDLRRFLDGKPIKARPTPVWERMVKWARRRPAAASLVLVAILFALALLASIGLYVRNVTQWAESIQLQAKVAREVGEFLLEAQAHQATNEWYKAQATLQKAQGALNAQPDLEDAELRAEVTRRLNLVQHKVHELEHSKQAQGRHKQFGLHRFDALFYLTQFTGLDDAASWARARTAASAALAIYSNQGEAAAPHEMLDLLAHDQPYHKPADRTDLTSACYELLLMLADMEAAGPPNTEGDGRQRADKALALLARAARLGLPSRTGYLLHARCLAQSKGEPFDPVAAARDAPPRVDRLDWFLAGFEHYRKDRWAEAIAACDKVLEEQPKDYWANYIAALAQMRLGHWTDAERHWTVCLNLKDNFAWPLLFRGFAASEHGAAQIKQNPALAAREFSAAAKDLNAALKLNAGPLARYVGLVNRGVLSVRQGQWDRAVADLRQAVALKPDVYQGHLNLAQALEGQGKPTEALAAMNEAIARAPQQSLALVYASRAELHLRQRHRSQARDDFQKAIALEPKGNPPDRLVKSLLLLGKLLAKEERYKEALACYEKVRRRKPKLLEQERFWFETLLGLKRYAEAQEALDAYLTHVQPAQANVYWARAILHARKGEVVAALQMYTLALWQDPNDSEVRCQRGWAYLLYEAPTLAFTDFQTCLKAEPGNVDALLGRGNAYIKLKELPKALADARAAEKRPLSDRLTYNLGRIYAQAAQQLAAKVRTGQDADIARQVAAYKEKAVECLQRTLALKKTEEQRASLWRREVQIDPAFAGLRAWPAYVELQIRYGEKR
jgi:tetratricopeptide (TPR) repeat protein/tRNA A-37 threonylcarbamoyl transferase component Bud32